MTKRYNHSSMARKAKVLNIFEDAMIRAKAVPSSTKYDPVYKPRPPLKIYQSERKTELA